MPITCAKCQSPKELFEYTSKNKQICRDCLIESRKPDKLESFCNKCGLSKPSSEFKVSPSTGLLMTTCNLCKISKKCPNTERYELLSSWFKSLSVDDAKILKEIVTS